MKFNIYDYSGEPVEVDVELKDVKIMSIAVVSGDEILKIRKNDGEVICIDSSDRRTMNFYDGEYNIFDPELDVNLLEDDCWMSLKDSYERLYYPN